MASDEANVHVQTKSSPPARTIGAQLLLWVNGAWFVLAAVFLVYDYRSELSDRMEDKRIALHEEAKTLMPAVLQIRRYGRDDIQQYVDAVCGQMRDAQSPGHHIIVESKASIVQAHAHHRASPGMLASVHRAAQSPTHKAEFATGELVVGSYTDDGSTIYVSETLENLRRAVIGDALTRLIAMFLMAVVATAIVNLVLWRIVARPLKRLVGTVKKIGAGKLGTQSDTFGSSELDFLAREINAMSVALEKADKDRRQQMAQAREIQQSLLPKPLNVAGLRVSSLFQPTDDVGGDYFDAFTLADGSHLFTVADVTGHGVPAAMSAAMLKVLLVQAARQHTSPAAILQYINRVLIEASVAVGFVTMAVARVSRDTTKLEYASAGHETSWLFSLDGTIDELTSTGMVLGVLEDGSWEDTCKVVSNGQRLLITTDGVSEALSPSGEFFGREKIRVALVQNRDKPSNHVLPYLTEQLNAHRQGEPQYDDVTMVLIEIGGPNRAEPLWPRAPKQPLPRSSGPGTGHP